MPLNHPMSHSKAIFMNVKYEMGIAGITDDLDLE